MRFDFMAKTRTTQLTVVCIRESVNTTLTSVLNSATVRRRDDENPVKALILQSKRSENELYPLCRSRLSHFTGRY